MKAQMQKGFTLIELMIVVAIIGILAAIAIPQYQNYVGRANFASALSTLSSLKTNIESYILDEGAFPTDAELTADTLGMVADANDRGEITLAAAGTDGGGTATFTFDTGNPGINGKEVTLTRDDDGVWSCETDADEKYVKGCEVGTTTP